MHCRALSICVVQFFMQTCVDHHLLSLHVKRSASALHEMLPGNGLIPPGVMTHLVRAVANHTTPFAPPHHWQHIMLHNGNVFIAPRGVHWPDQMRGGLVDLLGEVAQSVGSVEFVLYYGDVLDAARIQTWAKQTLGLPAVPIVSYSAPAEGSCLAQRGESQRYATFLVPCYYDTVIDDLCAADVPPFEERGRSVVFGSYAFACPIMSTNIHWWGCNHRRLPVRHKRGFHHCPREEYAKLSMSHTDKLDVRLYGVGRRAQMLRKAGIPQSLFSRLPLLNHSRYAYLLDVDGLGRACRFEQLLALGSVVLKQDSQLKGHAHEALRPGDHFVAVAHPSKIFEQHRWLRKNPEKAAKIAANGRAFACTHLTSAGRRCSWIAALQRYKGLLQAPATPAERPWLKRLVRLECSQHQFSDDRIARAGRDGCHRSHLDSCSHARQLRKGAAAIDSENSYRCDFHMT